MDQLIADKAFATTKLVSNWEFQPIGSIIINEHDTDSQIGGLVYSNTNYIFHGALKVKNWVFVLEKMTNEALQKLAPTSDKDMWYISAFNGNSHYTFAGFKGVDESELNVVLIEYIIDNFWNILYPEVHKENTENTWEIYPL